MSTPNMATITASIERSLQNCSLHHEHSSSSDSTAAADAGAAADGSDSPTNPYLTPTLELNSQATLPFHWEQCLDLKTGEIYYINWRTGMKAKEDPRTTAEYGGDYYSDDDNSSYDSDGSCSESSPSTREQWSGNSNNNQESSCYQEKNEIEDNTTTNKNFIINNNLNNNNNNNNNNNVLVVAGCKSCLMYYMVPKQLEICPKCGGQLLHFDRSENGSS